jgi:PAS domain-containing protein
MTDMTRSAPQAPDMPTLARLVDFLNGAGTMEEGLSVILQSIRAAVDADVALVCLGEDEKAPVFHVSRAGVSGARVKQAVDHARSLQTALTDPFASAVDSAFEWEWKREIKVGEFSSGIIYVGGESEAAFTPLVELLIGMMMQFILRFYEKGGARPAVSATATAKMANIGALTRTVGTKIRVEEDIPRIAELIRKLTGSDQMILISKRAGSTQPVQAHAHPPLSQTAIKQIVHTGLMAAHVLGGGDPIYQPIANSGDEEAIRKLGWKSAAAFPIRESEHIVGGLLLFGVKESMFSEPTAAALDPVLLQITSILSHNVLSHELRQTQRQWEVTFDSMTDCVIVADLTARIIRANRALGTRLRIPPEALCGRTIASVLDIEIPLPEERHSVQAFVDIPKLGGTYNVSVSAVLDSPTSPEAYVIVARDVTLERKNEARLRTLAHATEALMEGVGISTMDGDLVYANPALKRLLGIPPEDAGVPIDDGGLFRELSRHGSWEGELHATRRGGEKILVYAKITPILESTGKPSGLVGIVRDVSKEKTF